MKNKVKLSILLVLTVVSMLFVPMITANAEEQMAYLGGIPLGIGLAEQGLIITGMVDVITDEGVICPARGSEISTNDVIIMLNGEEILNVSDFTSKVQRTEKSLVLTVKRGDRVFDCEITPVTDSLTGLKKLGLTIKEGINGIGTLTFVLPNENAFGALGHAIVDGDSGKPFLTDQGSIYFCKINGFKRPEGGKAGELSGSFIDRLHPIGRITKCNEFGVYGVAYKEMYSNLQKVKIGSRAEVKTGPARIYTTISGNHPIGYDVEIVKTANQKKAHDKSMLIRVTDDRLLAETGGILQGMSGSPIVQDGKLIGAVTHVLISDSTLGYGLYIDWMLENVA